MGPLLRLTAALGLILLAACSKPPQAPRLDLERSSYSTLSGWPDEDQGPALQAFQRSCGALAAMAPGFDRAEREAAERPAPGCALPSVCDFRTRFARISSPELFNDAGKTY